MTAVVTGVGTQTAFSEFTGGLKTSHDFFRQSLEAAKASKVLAANQGLYNGFLAAGLFWGLSLGSAGNSVVLFFLHCVLVAGVFGAMTVSRKILFIQAAPAAVGIVLTLLAR